MSGTTTLHRFAWPAGAARGTSAPARGIQVPLVAVLGIAALSAAAGALWAGVLDRPADANAVPRGQPVAAPVPTGTLGRDPSVPDASSVFAGRHDVREDPPATF